MQIYAHVAAKAEQERLKLHSMKLERKRLERTLEDLGEMITRNAHAPASVKEQREKVAIAEGRIKQLDRELSAPWKAPTLKQIEEMTLLQVQGALLMARLCGAHSTTDFAVFSEKPKREADARKEVAEVEVELPRVYAKLRKLCEAADLGADHIQAICGRAPQQER